MIIRVTSGLILVNLINMNLNNKSKSHYVSLSFWIELDPNNVFDLDLTWYQSFWFVWFGCNVIS